MLPTSFWDGVAYVKNHNANIESRKPKLETIEDYCNREREWIKRGDGVNPAVLAGSFIRLFIWRYGPRDVNRIDLLLDGLRQLKIETQVMDDREFYQIQIDAYKLLRFIVQQGRLGL